MSSLISGILGSRKATTNDNQAFGMLKNDFGSTAANASNTTNMLNNLLGMGDTAAGNAAFDKYRNSTGYDFQMGQGTQAIVGNAASKGLLQSGSLAKGLTQYGQGLAASSFNDYLKNVMGLNNQALQAGQVLAGAGSKTVQPGKGLLGLLGI